MYKQAKCYKKLARFKEAITLLEEAIRMSQKYSVSNNVKYNLCIEYASCCSSLGYYKNASDVYLAGFRIFYDLEGIKNNKGFFMLSIKQILSNAIRDMVEVKNAINIHTIKEISDYYYEICAFENKIMNDSSIDSLCMLSGCVEDAYVEFMIQDGCFPITIKSAMDDIKNLYGTNIPLYIKATELLAYTSFASEDYYEAYCVQKEILPSVITCFGNKSPEYMSSLKSMSKYSSAIGNYKDALEYGKQALDLCSALYGEENIIYAEILENFALCHVEKGDYSEGLYILNTVKDIKRTSCGENNIKYYETISNIADVQFKAGNYNEAIPLMKETLTKQNNLFQSGEYNTHSVKTLEKLCNYLSETEQYESALETAKKVIVIKDSLERIVDPTWGKGYLTESPYIRSYSDLYLKMANCYLNMGESEKALELIKKVNDVKAKEEGELGYNYRELSMLANIYANMGDYDNAIESCRKSIEFIEDELGVFHPFYVNSLYNLATYEFNVNNREESLKYITEYYEKAKESVLLNIANMSSRERTNLWQKYSNGFTNTIPQIVYNVNNEETGELLYNTVLFSKGILLNTNIEMTKLLTESGNKELLETYQMLLVNKSILNKCYEYKTERFNVDSLKEVINMQERELMRNSHVYGDCTKSLRTNWEQVRNSLNTDEIAIEFVSFNSNDGERIYLALTLRNTDTKPAIKFLCTEKQMKNINPTNYYSCDSLYNLIWEPLKNELSGVRKIYFSPTGILNNIAIEYLPISVEKTLAEQYSVYRLSSTRELVEHEPATNYIHSKAVLYGGLNYDADIAEISKKNDKIESNDKERHYAERALSDSISLRGGIQYLEGTMVEVEEINATLHEKNVDCRVFSDIDGTEESFKNLSGQPIGILHVATHGFYLPESQAKKSKRLPFLILDSDKSDKEDKSLSRSGLLLTGASNVFSNKPIPASSEDGVLTAKEIANIDFRNLNLVVLSACQSGLGDILGDDVFGLQRGFKMAGAKSLVMSLWKVNDEATFMLMSEFYANIAKGQGINEAFRNSQIALRTVNDGEYNDPKYWAAFVLLDVFEKSSGKSNIVPLNSNKTEQVKGKKIISPKNLSALDFLKDFYKEYIKDSENRNLKKCFSSKGYSKKTILSNDYDVIIEAQDDVPYDEIKITEIEGEWFSVKFEYSPDVELRIKVINSNDQFLIDDIKELWSK